MGKLSQQIMDMIEKEYCSGQVSYQQLADKYGVSKATITRVLNPKYAEKTRNANRERIRLKRNDYKKKIKRYYLDVNINKDADIIQKCDSLDNRQKYIKDLIRKDIERDAQKN